MPTILLIRHGETNFVKEGRLSGRLPNVHLNEKGRAQAKALAEKLAQAPIKAVYSSPLERAYQTAEPIAQALGLEVVLRPGLIETDCGEWQGKSLKSLRRLKLWRSLHNSPSLFRFPGGESIAESQRRICSELETLYAQHQADDLIVCVSHADPIRMAVAFLLGMPLDHYHRLFIAPASITALHLGDSGPRLLTLNYDPSFTFTQPNSGILIKKSPDRKPHARQGN
jgi:probable phosphoglycerate mutase